MKVYRIQYIKHRPPRLFISRTSHNHLSRISASFNSLSKYTLSGYWDRSCAPVLCSIHHFKYSSSFVNTRLFDAAFRAAERPFTWSPSPYYCLIRTSVSLSDRQDGFCKFRIHPALRVEHEKKLVDLVSIVSTRNCGRCCTPRPTHICGPAGRSTRVGLCKQCNEKSIPDDRSCVSIGVSRKDTAHVLTSHVRYQPGGSSGYNPGSRSDPLSNGTVCLRDAALMQRLGVSFFSRFENFSADQT